MKGKLSLLIAVSQFYTNITLMKFCASLDSYLHLISLLYFMSFMHLPMVCRIRCSVFLGIKVRLTALWFPTSSFPPFWKRRVTFAFLQSLYTSPTHHGQPRIIASGLTTTSASPLSIYGCIPSGAWTYLFWVRLCIPWPDPLPSRGHLPCSSLSPWSVEAGIPEGYSCR